MVFSVLVALGALAATLLVLKLVIRPRVTAASVEVDVQRKLLEATREAERRVQAAKSDATLKRDEVRRGFAETLDQMGKDLKDMGERLERREQTLKTRDEAVSERRRNVQQRETDLKQRQTKIVPAGKYRAEIAERLREKLIERSGSDVAALIQELVEARTSDANLHATNRKLAVAEEVKLEAERKGKRVISIANERFNMSHQPDTEHPGFRLSDPEIVAKVAEDASFKDAFIAATDAELNLSDDGRSVDVRGVDPLKREISRRTLVYMKNQGVVHVDRIPTVLQRVQKEVDKELERAAEKATRILRIAPLEGEVKRLFSRLLYRASYSQNQWHHAVEVAYVCGMMAAELGLDVKVARRAGLLHDIGKAMTHDHEGSHALLGADVARRQGEPEDVCNAIGAHHGEEPITSPYAEITAAGDAISGARPGARREIQEAFASKVHDLERIARAARGVERVHVMQGGREVRVFVGERETAVDSKPQVGWDAIYGKSNGNGRQAEVRDENMPDIARQIAEQIESELTYPGQIRVTVIRESRAVGIAR